jgi:hypothetical protein
MEVSTADTGAGSPANDAAVMREVIVELQRAFTHMKLCRHGVVDLSRFVGKCRASCALYYGCTYRRVFWLTALLQLDKGVQQDPQEFNKLFLSKVESSKFQPRDMQRTVFKDLLRGRMKYSTSCLGCKQVRNSPEHDFHELDLSIEGASSVEQALEQYLAVEELCGENRVDCSTCGGRRNAQRAVVIGSTPPMLCLHLLRYSYDRQTFDRKKLTNEVTFPDVLTLCGEQYKLTSVLYHKGRSAYGGHYVCDALDWETGQWWHFDDDVVSRTADPALAMSASKGSQPSGDEVVVCGANAQSPKKGSLPAGSPTTKKRASPKVFDLQDDDIDNASEVSEYDPFVDGASKGKTGGKRKRAQPTPGGLVDMVTSSAMQRGAKKGGAADAASGSKRGKGPVEVDLTGADASMSAADAAPTKATVNRKRDAYMLTYVKIGDYEACLHSTRVPPTETLVADTQNTSHAFLERVHAYEVARARVLAEAEERKSVYNTIKESFAPQCRISPLPGQLYVAHHKDFYLVPADWLQQWIRGHPTTFFSIANSNVDKLPAVFTEPADSEVVILESEQATSAPDAFIPVRRFLCPHERGLDVAHQDKFKVISPLAYEAIFKSDSAWQQMDLELTHATYACALCSSAICDQRVAAHNQAGENNRILRLIDATTESNGGTGRRGGGASSSSNDAPESPLGGDPSAPAYWLHRPWLTQFRKLTGNLQKKAEPGKSKHLPLAPMFSQFITTSVADGAGMEASGDKEVEDVTPSQTPALDPTVNSALFCEHKMPALNYQRKAVKVSAEAWDAVTTLFPEARAVQLSELCCVRCESDVKNQQQQLLSNKELRSLEVARAPLASLSKARRIYPAVLDAAVVDDDDFAALPPALYAVDGKWVAHWRKYTQDPNFPAPAPLTNAKLRCQHGKAFLPLTLGSLAQGVRLEEHDVSSLLVYKFQEDDLGASEEEARYMGAAKLARTSSLPLAEVVTEAQWETLLEFHGSKRARGDHTGRSDSDMETYLEEEENSGEGENNADAPFACRLLPSGDCAAPWRWEPEVCAECLALHESLREASQAQYVNATMPVVLLRDADAYLAEFHKPLPGAGGANAASEGAGQASAQPVRTSQRNRGRRSTAKIVVDSSDSLSIVRLKICEAFRVDLPPSKQQLFDRKGDALNSHTMSLTDCGVKSTDSLYVMECAAGAEDWGMLDCFNAPKSRAHERGFTGTLLTRGGDNGATTGGHAGSSTEEGTDVAVLHIEPDTVRAGPRAVSLGKRKTSNGRPSTESSGDDELQRALELSVQSAAADDAALVSAPYEVEVYSLLDDSQVSAPQASVPGKAAIEPNEPIVPLSEDALAMMLGLVESAEAYK